MIDQQNPDARLRTAWEEIWHACEAAEEEGLLEVLTAIQVLWTLGAHTAILPILREMIAWLRSQGEAN